MTCFVHFFGRVTSNASAAVVVVASGVFRAQKRMISDRSSKRRPVVVYTQCNERALMISLQSLQRRSRCAAVLRRTEFSDKTPLSSCIQQRSEYKSTLDFCPRNFVGKKSTGSFELRVITDRLIGHIRLSDRVLSESEDQT